MADTYELSELNIFDKEEIHKNCVVQILHNSITGDCSVGWWENEWRDAVANPPEEDGEYLCIEEGYGCRRRQIYKYEAGFGWYFYDADYGDEEGRCGVCDITHWMELPPLPEEDLKD